MDIDTVVEWGEVAGVPITFPMEVRAFDQATLLFTVPSEAAAALLPGDAFEIAEAAPGLAQLVVAICAYRENPWGDYDEFNFGFLVRRRGSDGLPSAFVYRMPVNQEFTCLAGNAVMGFPKTVEDIRIEVGPDEVDASLSMGGSFTMRVRLPRVAATGAPPEIETVSFSYLDGRPHATPLRMQLPGGIVDSAAVSVEIGDGAVADELRSLGLPRRPDVCMWGEGLSGTFGAPVPV